jgi:hypothetical protein
VTPGNLRPQFKPFMILSTAKLNPTSTGQILEAGSATQHCDFYCMLSYPLGIEHSYGKSPFLVGQSPFFTDHFPYIAISNTLW